MGPEIITEPTLTAEQSAERSLQLALAAARSAAENRGQDIVLLDMREITPIFDYFLVVTGSSRRQLHALSEEIDHALEDELGDQRMGIEGYNESHWILLDYGTVVIHLFDQETREYYALEDFWNAAVRVPLSCIDPGPSIDPGPDKVRGPGMNPEPATKAEPDADGEPGTETQ
jgi:ribosome-associated protein